MLLIIPIIFIYFYNSYLTQNILLFNLTKIFINQYWFLLLFVIFISWFKIKLIISVNFLIYLMVFSKTLKYINIPLSNTLFIIHPNLLILCFCFLLLTLINVKTISPHMQLIFLLNSLFLGGYWALQELNWGGWWNWDSIEMYVFYITLFYLSYFHKYLKQLPYTFKQTHLIYFLVLNFLLYFLLNRLGVTISIHRFVKSNFLKYFTCWYFYSFIIVILYFCKKSHPGLCVIYILYVFFYTQFHTWYFLKKYFIYVLIHYFFQINLFFKKKLFLQTHKVYYYLSVVLILFNFFNKSIFLKCYDTCFYLTLLIINKVFLFEFNYLVLDHLCGIKKFFFYKVLNNKNYFFFNFFIKKNFLHMYYCLNFSKI
jgi:hypothetical protein